MRRFLGNVAYAVSVCGILAAFFLFLLSGNPGADVDGTIFRGFGYLVAGLVLFFVSQKISPDRG